MILNPSAAAVLLSAGADPNLRGPRGVPPLGSIIVSTTQEPDTSMLELCLDNGARFGYTALLLCRSAHTAARTDDPLSA